MILNVHMPKQLLVSLGLCEGLLAHIHHCRLWFTISCANMFTVSKLIGNVKDRLQYVDML